jgi:predicted O-linked N-acetylglucosamine transferase (SPINDLY family)
MLRRLILWVCRKYAVRNMARGDLQAAARMWSIAIACGDDSPQTQRNLGELYFRLGDFANAIPLLASAATHYAGDGPLATMLAQARRQSVQPASVPAPPAPGPQGPSLAQSLRDVFDASYPDGAAEPAHPAQLFLRTGGDDFDALQLMRVLGARPGRSDEAIELIVEALRRNPGSAEVHVLLGACAWSHLPPVVRSLHERVTTGASGDVAPLGLLPLSDSNAGEQCQCARQYAQQQYGEFLSRPPLHLARSGADRERLRIGYLSADYHEHPTSFLVARVIERHDRERFEVFGYSCGPDTADPMRQRMRAAFDTFRDIRPLPVETAAQQIVEDGIDILVDLNGYTTNARPEILAMRPAPVQVSWLGFPGTLGHSRLADYLIGDPMVSPLSDGANFAEALALMPNCYQPNDQQRLIGERPSRAAAGLPADGFVFCSFNQSYKFTPAMFDIWCRLLAAVPGSVLWLLDTIEAAAGNLRREAQLRGIAPERIVFAPRRTQAEHLARLQLADVALDTFPYTSHTTASDALWAGVPLVAMRGHTFASRVSGSILHAAGLPELVAESPEDFYRVALELATVPAHLAQIRARLAAGRMTCALFDSKRFALDLERLFGRMWRGYRAGKLEPIMLDPHGD